MFGNLYSVAMPGCYVTFYIVFLLQTVLLGCPA